MNATITENIPAERTKPGKGIQRVNLWDGGEFVRQVTFTGTVRQARAYALLQLCHDTDPAYGDLLAALRGEG